MPKKKKNQELLIDNKGQLKKENHDWITALAKQVTSETNNNNNNNTIKSKAERIEKRNAKRKRREQTKGYTNESRKSKQQRQHQQQQEQFSRNDHKSVHRKQTREECMVKLHQLSNEIDMAIQLNSDTNSSSSSGKRIIPFVTSSFETKKGKAVAGMTIKSSSQIQPRKRDYNGLGLARPSIF